MTERQQHTVSYFQHERLPLDLIDTASDIEEIIEHGFDQVVLCVSETTMGNSERIEFLKKFIFDLKEKGITVHADPWGFAGAFGGEADSQFKTAEKLACSCNEEFDELMIKWVSTSKKLGVDGVFWDEPEIKCRDHDMVSFLDKYTTASKNMGMKNYVCLTANMKQKDLLDKVAGLESVDGIGTDPYIPNAFSSIEETDWKNLLTEFELNDEISEFISSTTDKSLLYVLYWSLFTKQVADKYDKEAHIWVQGFGIKIGDLEKMQEINRVIQMAGISQVMLWGFGGCKDLFNDSAENERSQDVWEEAGVVFSRNKARQDFAITSAN